MTEPPDALDPPVPGVTSLDHTADVGLLIDAPDLPELLRRSALGLAWLLSEAPPPPVSDRRPLRLEAADAPALLRDWLRELLRWHQDDGFLPVEVRVTRALEGRVEAIVEGGVSETEPVREIKGVTFHDLAAEPRGGGWWGRVVFDV